MKIKRRCSSSSSPHGDAATPTPQPGCPHRPGGVLSPAGGILPLETCALAAARSQGGRRLSRGASHHPPPGRQCPFPGGRRSLLGGITFFGITFFSGTTAAPSSWEPLGGGTLLMAHGGGTRANHHDLGGSGILGSNE
uniref:Uncharacterized protein n=1 Tax=Oryza sativa subsp. japonica TaxID=39947 RepID=Q851I8_ORYSJ|nr:hypothetical protein [Oryza sativa Japonica Group]